MKIVQLTAQQTLDVKGLQTEFQAAQKAHMAAYQKLLGYLKSAAGANVSEQPGDQGRKTKIAVSDDGQHIVVG